MSSVMQVGDSDTGRLHPYVAGILASISGFLMVSAGMALSEGVGSARPFALGGGIAIQAALFMERRGVRVRAIHRRKLGRPIALQSGTSMLMLAAGAGLVWIGHRSSVGGWWPSGLAFTPIVVLLGAAAVLNRQAAAARELLRTPNKFRNTAHLER